MAGNDGHNILISGIALQRTLEIGAILARRFLFALAVGIHIQQEILRIIHPCNARLILRIIAGTQHNINFIGHCDVTHTTDRTAGIQILHIAVGTALKQVFVIADIIRIKICRTGKIPDFRTNAIQVAPGILELVEHISGYQFHGTHTLQIVAQPLQDEGGNHLRLPDTTVAIDFHHKNAPVVFFHGKQ